MVYAEDEWMLGIYCGEGYRVGGCGDRGCHSGKCCVEGHNYGDCDVGGLSCWWRGGGCVEIHSDGSCGVRGCRVCVCIEEGYSIRGCRVEGCRGGVTVLRGYGVGGCCEGRAYVNDVMGGVCWWSELMRLRKRTMELRDWILWKCVTRNTILGIAVWDCVATGVTEVGEKAGG